MLFCCEWLFYSFFMQKKEKDYLLYPSSFYSFWFFVRFYLFFVLFSCFYLFLVFLIRKRRKGNGKGICMSLLFLFFFFSYSFFVSVILSYRFSYGFFMCLFCMLFRFFLYVKEIQKGKINSLCINLLRNLIFDVLGSPSNGKN